MSPAAKIEYPKDVEEIKPEPEVEPEVIDSSPNDKDIIGDDELWPDGPTFNQVEEWKTKYGDVYVTSVTPDTHFVWRTIKRSEYRMIVMDLEKKIGNGAFTQAEATMNNEEAIAATCILFPLQDPSQVADQLAGVAAIISQEVLEASAFQAVEIRQL